MKKLDLLLVNPGNSTKMYQTLAGELRGIEPPILAGLIANSQKSIGMQVNILDADMENLSPEQTADKIIKLNPNRVCIVVQGNNPSASSTPKMSAVIDLVHIIKSKSNFLVSLAGIHPSALPERSLLETGADYILKENFSGELGADWDLINPKNYRAHNWHCFGDLDNRSPYGVIYTSYGCPYSCDYCNIHVQYPIRFKHRDIKAVLSELDLLVQKHKVKNIKIADELFALNERKVVNICNRIIERNYELNMWAYARVNTVTPKMLSVMKNAGINWLGYGFESSSDLIREGVSKKFNQFELEKTIRMTKDAGINIIANFVFGLPDDDYNSTQKNLDMMKEYLFEYVNFYTCMAYPGSFLYDQISMEHPEWLPDNWNGYSQLGYETFPLPTKYLSAKEVLTFRDFAFKDYFTYKPYLDMIKSKFGDTTAEHIVQMTSIKIRRKLLGT